MNNLTQISRQF